MHLWTDSKALLYLYGPKHVKRSLTLCLLLSSADNHYKQFGPRQGPTKCRVWSGSKLFGTLVFRPVSDEWIKGLDQMISRFSGQIKDWYFRWMICTIIYLTFFLWVDSLLPSQQFFSHVRTGLHGLNQYWAEDKVTCSRTHMVRLELAPPRSQVKHSCTGPFICFSGRWTIKLLKHILLLFSAHCKGQTKEPFLMDHVYLPSKLLNAITGP